ncbi:hypothetical protein N7532_001711 [Penicillium argentinense]|uniref:Uncharacterized protein n=1 Tax=Penicillium argentinense TaxID=1131581 RepID=A0A9W9G315_9EURO|nr:uncharacterized protein N7532_001711 [Penicillium argentinense]KAJ5111176.1 hypothetical protein N7532_001711 [Penicillium argentinense]
MERSTASQTPITRESQPLTTNLRIPPQLVGAEGLQDRGVAAQFGDTADDQSFGWGGGLAYEIEDKAAGLSEGGGSGQLSEGFAC